MDENSSHGVQLSLLSGFVAKERIADPHSGVVLAKNLPIARVAIDSPLPHLDRTFDYSIPVELDAVAQQGVRVRVKFSGQELNGFVTERVAESESERLVPLGRVYSAVPVLTPQVLELANRVAARYSGTVADVLRVAIPPRVAGAEKAYANQSSVDTGDPNRGTLENAQKESDSSGTGQSAAHPGKSLFTGYSHAEQFLSELSLGFAPKGVLQSLAGWGPHAWHHQLAQVLAYCQFSGRGAIVVVPDLRDLEFLEKACHTVLPQNSFVKLTADDGPTVRYENFLRVLRGEVQIVIGTRSAAYAPVKDLGLVCCWDDGNELHFERRAPYQHSRDVLLLRSELEETAVLMAGHARSSEAQRLVSTGWAQPMVAARPLVRLSSARAISTADSYEQERDPLASLARLPHRAWQVARDALTAGPVLVQVARTGYAPALACQRCREVARCAQCTGPLMQSKSAASTQLLLCCRWCARVEMNFECPVCGNRSLRALAVGASRTAEELGRAFPSVPVISSAGDHVKATVGDRPAIVVATVGAEPVASHGYAAALLLDGDSLLRRESLRSGEDTLRRWMNAAALVRSAKDGGTVVVTADDCVEVSALIRWDPAGYAEREFTLRHELGLPPAVRVAALTGAEADVLTFTQALALPADVRIVGPAPLAPTYGSAPDGDQEPDYRTLLFFTYGLANTITGAMRALKATNAARRVGSPVQVRCDGVDLI